MLHTHTARGLSFLPLLHTPFTRIYWSAALSEDFFSGHYILKKNGNNPGLCPINILKPNDIYIYIYVVPQR